ncbi:MAG TPA: hypothetical protein VK841_16160 [Polyangiaceae bacterium]|nr:hypothetical protein [Polyangiaceae bacterium]
MQTEERRPPRPGLGPIDLGPLRELVAIAVEAEMRFHAAKSEYAISMAALARAARERPAERREMRDPSPAIRVTRQTLQTFAVVGTQWTASELRVLFERKDCHGHRISVSHLLLLARVQGEERQRRTEEVFADGLNLRDLRRRLRAGTGSQTA